MRIKDIRRRLAPGEKFCPIHHVGYEPERGCFGCAQATFDRLIRELRDEVEAQAQAGPA